MPISRLYDFQAGQKAKSGDVDAELNQLVTANNQRETDLTTHKNAATLDHPDGSVKTAKIADSAVTTAKIANSNVTSDKIADANVTTAKIADANVTNVKLANSAVDANKLASNAVTTLKIQDGAVTTSKIATGALDGRYYTETELDAGQLDNRYYTETETNTLLNAKSDKTTTYTKTEADNLLAQKTALTGNHQGTWQGLTPGEASEPINGGRLDIVEPKLTQVEAQLTKDQKQTSTITRALQIISTDQNTPVWMKRILGQTLANHGGNQGNFESQGQWDANLTIDTTQKKMGASSGKIDNSAGTAAKVSLNSQKSYLSGKKVLIGGWVRAVSGTPSISLALLRYDSAGTNTGGVDIGAKTIDTNWKFYWGKHDLSTYTDDHWKPRVDVRSFGTANDVVYFDGLVIYELPSTEFSYAHTQAEIESKYGYVDNVKPLQGLYLKRYGKNLLPTFYEWDLHANAKVLSAYDLELNATASWQESSVRISALPNTTYTVSKGSGNCQLYVDEDTATNNRKVMSSTDTYLTFTTSANVKELIIIVGNGSATSGTFTFSQPMLNLGSTALPFEPQNNDYLYLTTPLHGNGTANDLVEEIDGKQMLTKHFEEVVLDGSLAWSFGADYAGFKRVRMLSLTTNSLNNSDRVTKYDGKIIPNVGATWDIADEAQILDGNFNITVSDTDTGFGDGYTAVTSDEIKAIMNGWKADAVDAGGKPTSWIAILDSTQPPTDTTAYCAANKAPGWKGWGTLVYQRATPQTIELQQGVDYEGAISAFSGDNVIELGEAAVVREPVMPYNNGSGFYHINSTTTGYPTSNYLRYRAEKILNVYKGSEDDTANWTKSPSPAYGKERAYIETAKFDPTAQYYVTYIAEPYQLSAHAVDAQIGYATNLRSVVQRNVQDLADVKEDVTVLAWGKANKFQEQWIAPTLLNGWVKNGTNACSYFKDEFGIVHYELAIKNGVTTSGTIIMYFPEEYRPSESTPAVGSKYTSSTDVGVLQHTVHPDGKLDIFGTASTFAVLKGSFRAEQ
jgi:hypothetical protein